MFTKLAFVFVVALFGCASAQIISQKGCPSNIDVQCNFDVAGYLGIWYEYAKYPTNFEVNGTCISAQYTLQADGNVGVLNTLVNNYTGDVETISGYAQPVENAKLLVVFPGQPQLPGIKSNYWVLETDYTSYSVVYSCTPVPGLPVGSGTIVWILTRERQPTDSTLANAYNVMNKYGLDTTKLIQTDQSNCDVAGCP